MIRLLIILIFFPTLQSVSAQKKIEFIAKYFLSENDSTGRSYFKIANNIFSFDKNNCFYKNDKLMLSYPIDTFVTYEVYNDKFLIVSYYPLSESYIALGPGFRMKGRFDFISLETPDRKWEFDFHYSNNSKSIRKFNSASGELFVKYRIKKSEQINRYWK